MIELTDYIRDVPDFPKPGIVFKDITPLLSDGPALREAVHRMTEPFRSDRITRVAAVEARGFVFAAPIALELGVGVALIRKPGKLPHLTESLSYDLEYGSDTIEIHADSLGPADRVLLVDDVIATGGTIKAAADLVERLGATVAGVAFLIELAFLEGRAQLPGRRIHAAIRYD